MADLGRVGGTFGVVGLICILIAMVANNISGYAYVGPFDAQYSLTCRWQTFDGCWAPFICVYGMKYNNYCDNQPTTDPNPDSDWCVQRNVGQTWLAMLFLAMIISTIAVCSVFLSHFKKVQGYVKWLFLTSCILCILAVGSWIGGSNSARLCYDTNANGLYWGASLVLTVIAIISYIFAFAFTFKTKEGDYETLL
eukprot:141684_1